MLSPLKRLLLPTEPAPHTIRFGIARGVRMRLDLQHQNRLLLGIYELEVDRHLRRLLSPGMAAFDIGAQHGYDALAMARLGSARVATFECDPECLAIIDTNLELNPSLAGLITPVPVMVGAEPGSTGLDDWAYGGGGFVPDFMKIDVDGGEVSVLESATRLLAERGPAMIVETHSLDLEQRVGALLLKFGYRPVIVNQRVILADRRPTEHNRWLVCDPPAHGAR